MKITISATLLTFIVVACNASLSSEPTILPSSPTADQPTVLATSILPFPFKTSSSPSPASILMPSSVATATPEPVDVSGVSFAQLLNSKQGWAVADRRLFWTEDSGHHWRQVNLEISNEQGLENAFYLDSEHAWALICETQSSDSILEVAGTTDSGNSWKMSVLISVEQLNSGLYADNQWCNRENIGQLFFLNSQQGWIMVDATQTANSLMGVMFETLDGGLTWQRIGASPSGDFRFASSTMGWMQASCCTGGPLQLYRTQDSGKTWEVIRVKDSGEDDDFFLPFFFGQGEGVLAAILRDNGVPKDGITFFESHDSGTTWKPIDKLASIYEGLNIGGAIDVQVLDGKTWAVTLPGNGVYWTTDGGQHWVENKTATSIERLSLGSATSGWGLECVDGVAPACLRLVATKDSGEHWEYINIEP